MLDEPVVVVLSSLLGLQMVQWEEQEELLLLSVLGAFSVITTDTSGLQQTLVHFVEFVGFGLAGLHSVEEGRRHEVQCSLRHFLVCLLSLR